MGRFAGEKRKKQRCKVYFCCVLLLTHKRLSFFRSGAFRDLDERQGLFLRGHVGYVEESFILFSVATDMYTEK